MGQLPTFDLTGRTALVTGGSRGIGRAIALAAAGADVAVLSRGTDVPLRCARRMCSPLVVDGT